MMLSRAGFLEGDDVEHLLENAYDEIFRLAGEGDHPGLWVQFAKLLGATDEELAEVARKPLAEVIGLRATSASSSSDRKSTRLNSSHVRISYAVFCLKKKKNSNPLTAPS